MANNRTLTVVVLVSLLIAKSHTKGNQDAGSPNQASVVEKKLTDFREEIFMEGSDVTLWCGNATKFQWNEFIYIVWNISMQGRKCYIGLSPNSDNTCHDGKKLHNSSDGASLFIPKISVKDEGFYSCDFSYKGGSYAVNVSVSVTQLYTRLENENGRTVAVCKARHKNQPPALHWEYSSNIPLDQENTNSSEIRLYLDDNVTVSNPTCVATYSTVSGSVQMKRTLDLSLKVNSENPLFPWKIVAVSVGLVFVVLLSLAVVYGLRKKLHNLSALKTLCCKSKISTPPEDKPPQPPDDEEVQPYASYVQRENSIYNSSAELFNA